MMVGMADEILVIPAILDRDEYLSIGLQDAPELAQESYLGFPWICFAEEAHHHL